MKQTNQDQDAKQQGNPDQQKKTGAMQNGKKRKPATTWSFYPG